MTKVEIYNTDYTKLNHAYIEIYETYKKLAEAEDADEQVLGILGQILIAFNPTLDRIKSEMTVRTRYKDGSPQEKTEKNEKTIEQTSPTEESNGGKIFHPKFD